MLVFISSLLDLMMGFSHGLFLIFTFSTTTTSFLKREPACESRGEVAVVVDVVVVQSSFVTKIEFHFSLNSTSLSPSGFKLCSR